MRKPADKQTETVTDSPGRTLAGTPTPANTFVILVLLGLCVAARLPFFFPAVIDWDESTLILMGQSVLDGQLPYTELWDNKPPVAFLAYALLVAMFGKSVAAVRFGGFLVVTGTAYLTYVAGRSIWGGRAGLFAAALSILFISTVPSGQATMAEIIAILPLMGALAILLVKEHSSYTLFAAGLLLGVASLVRLNLAYVAFLVALYVLFKLLRTAPRSSITGVLAYVAGGLLPLILTASPYFFTGQGGLWIASVFLAPLRYSDAGYSAIEAFTAQLQRGFSTQALLWATSLLGAAWILVTRDRQTSRQRHGIALVAVFLLGTTWSIVESGAAYPHYLIQIVPPLSLIAGFLLDCIVGTRYRLAFLGVFSLALIVSVRPIVAQYGRVSERLFTGQSLSYGAAYQIAAFLEKENPHKKPVYLMTDHIAYWLTDTRPLTKATTHPSNIAKEYMLETFAGRGASTQSEMAKVLGMTPMFIVKEANQWYLRMKPEARHLLESVLAADYMQVAEIDGRYIYKWRSHGR